LRQKWLWFALFTTLAWGVWGAFIEIPEKAGFPATLGYSVWALTMIPCALAALRLAPAKLERDRRSILLGCVVGATGAGGQLLLFEALRSGPAFIVFPVVAMYPMLTILLSAKLLGERTSRRGAWGIALALPAIALLSYVPPGDSVIAGYGWLPLAAAVFILWGIQAYAMKFATRTMSTEGIFFYMAAVALALIPVAVWMTDFHLPINWGFRGPYLAAVVQVLNSVGALSFVHAMRQGKAMVVTPMTALSPVITIMLSLLLYSRTPLWYQGVGITCAAAAMYLMAE
jgi:drug/metabolite transporter (DMT)-like permease